MSKITTLFAAVLSTTMFVTLATAKEESKSQTQAQPGDQQQTADSVQIPKMLQQLDLTSDQQQQIREIIAKHENKLNQTWMQFHALHMQTLNMEGTLLAAFEGRLDGENQKKFQQVRNQDRQNRTQFGFRPENTTDENDADNPQDKPGKSSKKSRKQKLKKQQKQEDDQASADDAQDNSDEQGQGETKELDFLILSFRVPTPKHHSRGLNLSNQERQQCDEVCSAYSSEILQAWKQMERLHLQMVDIEADKCAEIASVLTEDQREELLEQQQQPDSTLPPTEDESEDTENSQEDSE